MDKEFSVWHARLPAGIVVFATRPRSTITLVTNHNDPPYYFYILSTEKDCGSKSHEMLFISTILYFLKEVVQLGYQCIRRRFIPRDKL